MKYAVILGLLALVSLASSKPCPECSQFKEGEIFDAGVDLLQKTLANLAVSEDGPNFKIHKAHSVAVIPKINHPIITVDLIDQLKKIYRCDVTIFRSLNLEDKTTEYKIEFDGEDFQITRLVNF